MSRTRLRELVFRGGTSSGVVHRWEGTEPLWNDSVRLTYDVRRATKDEWWQWTDAGWPRDIGVNGLFDVPLRQICFRTDSLEIVRYVEIDLDDMEENLADDIEENRVPRDTGVDEDGRTFRERIEITLEDDGPGWDEEEAELGFWRARGKERETGIEVGDAAVEEEEGTGLLED
jgi:hypothetical protein